MRTGGRRLSSDLSVRVKGRRKGSFRAKETIVQVRRGKLASVVNILKKIERNLKKDQLSKKKKKKGIRNIRIFMRNIYEFIHKGKGAKGCGCGKKSHLEKRKAKTHQLLASNKLGMNILKVFDIL